MGSALYISSLINSFTTNSHCSRAYANSLHCVFSTCTTLRGFELSTDAQLLFICVTIRSSKTKKYALSYLSPRVSVYYDWLSWNTPPRWTLPLDGPQGYNCCKTSFFIVKTNFYKWKCLSWVFAIVLRALWLLNIVHSVRRSNEIISWHRLIMLREHEINSSSAIWGYFLSVII